MGMLNGSGLDEERFLAKWFSEGKPQFTVAKRWKMPFRLLPDGDSLSDEYQSNRNVFTISASNIYGYVSENGYPLIQNYTYGRIPDKKIVDELFFYFQEKYKFLVQKQKDGN